MGRLRRVLSIQSHVVHGCVGNRAAALPLQLLGVETDVLNTVQYSNHVGYGSFAGEKLSGEQLWELLNGMHANGLLAPSHVLTGYMGSVEAIRAVLHALPLLRSGRPDMQFWCDPVLGDNGRLYVPPALVDVYRNEVVPLAHALLPNQFEAEILTGVTIRTVADARRACGVLHRRGVDLVVITSAQLNATAYDVDGNGTAATAAVSGAAAAADDAVADAPLPPLSVLLSRRPSGTRWRREYQLDVAQLPQRLAGAGDLFAALLLGWSCRDGTAERVPPRLALQRALSGVQSVLKHTVGSQAAAAAAAAFAAAPSAEGALAHATRPLGLNLLESIDDIRHPDKALETAPMGELAPLAPMRLDAPLRAIVFDMDGTLTLGGQLDFARMRRAAGLAAGADIRAAIEALPAASERVAAWAAVEAIEVETMRAGGLQPGLKELIEAARRRGLLMALATRNSRAGVEAFLAAAALPRDTFAPILTREGAHPDKPHPAIVLAACAAWGVAPRECLMVGDSMDDMRCGHAAGLATCLVAPADSERAVPPLAAEVDFAVTSLEQLEAMLEDAVDAA